MKNPLVVDLDGTLVASDTLYELFFSALKKNALLLFLIPFWMIKGKAALKRFLVIHSGLDVKNLPYNGPFLDWLREQHFSGRILILCTGSDKFLAEQIAQHIEIFSEVYASDGSINLTGLNKANFLERKFGAGGFDYAGNSHVDLHVWKKARKAILVNSSLGLQHEAKNVCDVDKIFMVNRSNLKEFLREIRLYQWLKNVLLFVPLIASHQITNIELWSPLLLAFLSFGFCASSVYVLNDLLDLENDRRHPRKCNRPFSSGTLPILCGVATIPIFLLCSGLLAYFVGVNFLFLLIVYFALTCSYSFGFKKIAIIDCLILAILYTLRIIAGTIAIGAPISFWLLAFSVFIFLSLAFVKRYAELRMSFLVDDEKDLGRGYYKSDASLIRDMGVTSGYASALVLSLYLNSEVVLKLYKLPEAVWIAVPIILFWISWMWLNVHRGNMHDDPLIFAVKDRTSQLAGLAFLAVILVGSVGL